MNIKKTVKRIKKNLNKPYTKGDCVKGIAAATLATGVGFAGLAIWNAVDNARIRREEKERSEKIEFENRVNERVNEILSEDRA